MLGLPQKREHRVSFPVVWRSQIIRQVYNRIGTTSMLLESIDIEYGYHIPPGFLLSSKLLKKIRHEVQRQRTQTCYFYMKFWYIFYAVFAFI